MENRKKRTRAKLLGQTDYRPLLWHYVVKVAELCCRYEIGGLEVLSPYQRNLLSVLEEIEPRLQPHFIKAFERRFTEHLWDVLEGIYKAISAGASEEEGWVVIQSFFYHQTEIAQVMMEGENPSLNWAFTKERIRRLRRNKKEIAEDGGPRRAAITNIGYLLGRSETSLKTDRKSNKKDRRRAEKAPLKSELLAFLLLEHVLELDKGDAKRLARECVKYRKTAWARNVRRKKPEQKHDDHYGFRKLTGKNIPTWNLGFWDFDNPDNYDLVLS